MTPTADHTLHTGEIAKAGEGLALPQTRASQAIDRFLRVLGEALSWVWALLLFTIVANVTLRYVFGSGRIEFEELQWHLYAVGFLVGLSYCAQADAHIRIDVLRDRFSPRLQAWIEWYGTLLLVLPFITLVVFYGVPFVWESWHSSEVSASPGGLPYRWLIKAALPSAFALLGLAALSRLLRVGAFLFGASTADERAREG